MKCPYSNHCGGCKKEYRSEEYAVSLAAKQKEVTKLLSPFCRVKPILGAENPDHYRNKVHAVVSANRRGEIQVGTYEEGTHKVVDVDACLLDDERADAIIRCIKRLMVSFRYQPYNEDTGRGFLRHIQIRIARVTGQVMVTLVVADARIPSKQNFVKALLKEHPEITTIVANVNNRRTSMVLGDREEVLYGKGYIEDELCGKRFAISSKSFYQINHEQCEVLYETAMKMAELTGNEEVLDAYSGIGTIGICVADKAKSVVGVELNKDAVKDAANNCKLNNVKNCKFLQGDAGEFMVSQAAAGKHFDVVFMDPPRSGSDDAFLKSIVKSAPKKIVYISCNPETQARDLKVLTRKGYRVQQCQPVDLFPFTSHTESICLLIQNQQTKTH